MTIAFYYLPTYLVFRCSQAKKNPRALVIQQLSIQRNIQQTIQQLCPSERFAPVGRPIGSNYLAKASVVARAIALYRAHSLIKELGRARSTRCADLMEGSQGRRLASVCTQLEEDAGRNGRERRVENATHLLEAWDCIWSHRALAQARANQVAASSFCGRPVNDVSSQAAGMAPCCDMTAQLRGRRGRYS